MKQILIFCLVLACTACNNTSKSTTQSASGESQTENKEKAQIDKPSMEDAVKYVGKKPSEVDLFNQYNLNKRIENTLKSDYETFKANWNEETAIMKDGEILYFIGCKTGDCASNKYFVMLDMLDTNINIIFIRGGLPKSFEESAIIGMPENVANAFQKTVSSPTL